MRAVNSTADCYDYPQYWDLAFDDDTREEADFIVAAAQKYCDFPVRTLLEPGCGGGRLLLELAARGYDVVGWDLSESAVAFANRRLQAADLSGSAVVADMRTAATDGPVDMAYCLVNTFRHLLTEDDARQHLQHVAACLRPGGLYVIGLHLLPPDADEEDEEEWTVHRDGTTVRIQLQVAECDRDRRQEVLRFFMTASGPDLSEPVRFSTDYRMRLYQAGQIRDLLHSVPQFELVDVFDFWYDIEEPLTLSDELGDTVLVLRRCG